MANTRPRESIAKAPEQYADTVKIESQTVTETILIAIAEAKDIPVKDLDFRLYDYVDPESLNRLYHHSVQQDRGTWKFDFAVDDIRITVFSDGEVAVY